MWFQIKTYLKFLWKSKNQHGVHSPFVYDLVTECFYDRKQYSAYQKIKAFRNYLYVQNQFITVEDFGAGSRVFKSEKRQVSKIAKKAGISWKESKLLNRLTRYFDAKTIVELGTSVGLGSAALSAGNTAKIYTIEACPQTAAVAKNAFAENGFDNIEVIQSKFEPAFEKLPAEKIDMVYIDGNHREKPTLENFERLLPLISENAVFIFDDIHWSPEMESAWEKLKNHPKTRVTIDTFFWGIVFFKQDQAKQHFRIRV